jgi:hypothetical protein
MRGAKTPTRSAIDEAATPPEHLLGRHFTFHRLDATPIQEASMPAPSGAEVAENVQMFCRLLFNRNVRKAIGASHVVLIGTSLVTAPERVMGIPMRLTAPPVIADHRVGAVQCRASRAGSGKGASRNQKCVFLLRKRVSTQSGPKPDASGPKRLRLPFTEMSAESPEGHLTKERVMADDKSKQGPQDRSRINVNERYELDYWSKKFGVSEDELKRAVGKVGVMADDVERELKRRT